MGSKAAGITGGILILVGAGLIFYLWMAAIAPMINAMAGTKSITDLFVVDHLMYFIWCSDNGLDPGDPMVYYAYPDWIVDWLDPVGDLWLLHWIMFIINGNSTPVSSIFGIPITIFVYMVIGILGVGAILAFVGAGED